MDIGLGQFGFMATVALIIAGVVMLVSMAAPEAVYNIFKKLLYVF